MHTHKSRTNFRAHNEASIFMCANFSSRLHFLQIVVHVRRTLTPPTAVRNLVGWWVVVLARTIEVPRFKPQPFATLCPSIGSNAKKIHPLILKMILISILYVCPSAKPKRNLKRAPP